MERSAEEWWRDRKVCGYLISLIYWGFNTPFYCDNTWARLVWISLCKWWVVRAVVRLDGDRCSTFYWCPPYDLPHSIQIIQSHNAQTRICSCALCTCLSSNCWAACSECSGRTQTSAPKEALPGKSSHPYVDTISINNGSFTDCFFCAGFYPSFVPELHLVTPDWTCQITQCLLCGPSVTFSIPSHETLNVSLKSDLGSHDVSHIKMQDKTSVPL